MQHSKFVQPHWPQVTIAATNNIAVAVVAVKVELPVSISLPRRHLQGKFVGSGRPSRVLLHVPALHPVLLTGPMIVLLSGR
jgi:hypothetical protein